MFKLYSLRYTVENLGSIAQNVASEVIIGAILRNSHSEEL
jgi:hypothetical protein